MTGKPDISDEALEALFAEAREDPDGASDDFLARIANDALREQQGSESIAARTRQKWYSRAIESLGGWVTVSGLATAAMAGIWIGFANPSLVSTRSNDDVLTLIDDDGLGAFSFTDAVLLEEG